jgi:hypothetical protein
MILLWKCCQLNGRRQDHLCRSSACPIPRTFGFTWFRMNSACVLHNFLTYIVIHVRNYEKAVHLSRFSIARSTLFCRLCHVKKWASAAYSLVGQTQVITDLITALKSVSIILVFKYLLLNKWIGPYVRPQCLGYSPFGVVSPCHPHVKSGTKIDYSVYKKNVSSI